jgi:hypothetical protein
MEWLFRETEKKKIQGEHYYQDVVVLFLLIIAGSVCGL